jgi:hypothetical protein
VPVEGLRPVRVVTTRPYDLELSVPFTGWGDRVGQSLDFSVFDQRAFNCRSLREFLRYEVSNQQVIRQGLELSLKQPWIALSDVGVGRPTVLAIDFDTTGRTTGTFRDLIRLLPGTVNCWLSQQPALNGLQPLNFRSYVAWWTEGLAALPGRVDAVLGYCAGALFASALAEEIFSRQASRPAVVLLDPEEPSTVALLEDLNRAIASMTLLTPSEQAEFQAEARECTSGTLIQFEAACDAAFQVYRRASRTVLDRARIEPEVGEELMSVFRSYLPQGASATALLPGGHRYDPALARTQIQAGIPKEELLRDAWVAHTVYRLIGGER